MSKDKQTLEVYFWEKNSVDEWYELYALKTLVHFYHIILPTPSQHACFQSLIDFSRLTIAWALGILYEL